jgi:iron complex outermembrane receptor protein
MSKRCFTGTNDQSVGARTQVGGTIGWRLGGEGLAKGLAIKASVTNLFDVDYVAPIGSNGFGNAGDSQTLFAGAPRQWFLALRKDF